MKLTSTFSIEPADAAALLNAIHEGAVSALLGAGASYGALGGDGKVIRGAVDIAREINERLELNNEEPDCSNLPLVYADAAADRSKATSLNHFIFARFVNCTPSWQSILFRLPWKRIWSLNVDDVLDNALPSDFGRAHEEMSWHQDYKPRSLDRGELQTIYLHGRAKDLQHGSTKLIFSLKEYASRHEGAPGWHQEFRAEFVKKPFVVCGARLQDEYDLATVLDFGNKSRDRGGCPSFIVLKEMTDAQRSRYLRQGLVPIKASGEEFFSVLLEDYLAFTNALPHES